MAVNATAIKELRERTQAGMSDCKSALEEAEGDMEKAVLVILKKGLVKSAKRASAVAAEGEVRAAVTADKRAATMVEVNIQTDFAARNDTFKQFVGDVLTLAQKAPKGADLSTQPLAGKTVADIATELTAKIGEKVAVRRWERVEIAAGKHGTCAAYVHLGGKIGVLVQVDVESEAAATHAEVERFAEAVSLQIASMDPQVLRRAEISEEHVGRQKEIFEAQLREDPKTAAKEAHWPKMIEGKVNKWFSEIALLEQESVDPASSGHTIDKLRELTSHAAGAGVHIARFVRFKLGEGIDTGPKDDFAAEVAKMAGG